MSRADDTRGQPRAVIHKRILDVAESRPDASLEGIADEVGGATADLVERVLDEYGDPADRVTEPTPEQEQNATETTPEHEHTMAQNGQTAVETTEAADSDPPDPADLSPKQRKTIRLVAEHPDWSQADIAERLDVTRATVSRRLNDIPGFDWQNRTAFVGDLFDGVESLDEGGPKADSETSDESSKEPTATPERELSDVATGPQAGTAERFDEFDERLGSLETDVDELRTDGSTVDLPPELAHKVVHACMESDRISEDEELQLLKALMAE